MVFWDALHMLFRLRRTDQLFGSVSYQRDNKPKKPTQNKSFQLGRQWHAVYCGETFMKRGTKKSLLSETHRPLGSFQRNLATRSQKAMPKSHCVLYSGQEGPQKKPTTEQNNNKKKPQKNHLHGLTPPGTNEPLSNGCFHVVAGVSRWRNYVKKKTLTRRLRNE